MIRMMAAFAALLVGTSAAGQSGRYSARCDLWVDKGASHSGTCSISSSIDAKGRYVETVRAGRTVITLVQISRQGVWANYLINGKPGVRFEADRTSYHYSTLALDLSLDISS